MIHEFYTGYYIYIVRFNFSFPAVGSHASRNTEGVHAGVSTEKAQKFCHARIPRLVEILTSNYDVEIVNMTLGQGLMVLADPDYRVRRFDEGLARMLRYENTVVI